MTRAVVTGYGAVTPVGLTAPDTWEALLLGATGVDTIKEDWAADLPVRIAARVDDAFAEGLTVREARRTDRAEQLTLVAGREAWSSAGSPDVDPTRLAVVVGSANGGIATTLDQSRVLDEQGHRRVSPHTVTMLMANGPAAWLSIDLGAQAGARAPISACAAGSEAITMGREMILAGSADVVVCGGVEAGVRPFSLAAFAAARAMSTRNDEPERASRPFDVHRDGFVMGEGATLLVLESEEHARARGATVHGVVAGSALTSDAFDIVGGDPENQARTIGMALRSAGLSPGDVGLVHAHATSTPVGDVNESDALRAALGTPPPVTSTKGATGHLLGASGALGILVALLAVRDGRVPPTLNLDALDPAIDLDVVRGTAGETTARHALVNAFGFGGHSASVVVSRD
ncbi:beta-ketoacyl-[acyl-carrier-protein] synthase family protein [Cellulosimicrobium protaetiae]|uniref:Beta-ketoacyl-[acyl-carrier-protein] synthase family protein n=1 Tax=Cellulosimicrobium protaetiae TaxID=2587808 RepID=A0A6M5UA11_9MICO|nr:beta-ketoacyl-[acyl-carrier-protein] synthase family protein [Cellulosimicrobium protaetiae]QJW35347.1 beta-ketoacyl-[acyl-carrier-protein] synthase family protein [Cellulosimicrobium protaetiae]